VASVTVTQMDCHALQTDVASLVPIDGAPIVILVIEDEHNRGAGVDGRVE
jgi:hypothetical protein